MIGLIFFITYINNLPTGIQSICKISADDKSLFSKCQDFKLYEKELNKDLTVTKKWAL